MKKSIDFEVLDPIDLKKVEIAIKEIQKSLSKELIAIMQTADLLFKYKMSNDWLKISEQLDERNIMKDSVQKYYIGIAQNPVLMNSAYWDKLPPFYNNLYQLSRIKGAALVKLIETNKVHPSLTLENTREFAEKYAPSKQSKTLKSLQANNAKQVTNSNQAVKESEPTTFNVSIEIKFSKKYGSQKQIDNALNWLNDNLTDAVAKLI